MMKKKDLEIFLEQVPDFSDPKPGFEQYKTPATIASDILFQAYASEDISDKHVLDLGCGTGIFSFGAKILNAKQVMGIDKDQDCIDLAVSFAKKHQFNIDFICTDVSDVSEKVDTVLMNPPFGAQKQNIHADRPFLEKATSVGSVVYSLHLEQTLDFINKLLKSLKKEGRVLQIYDFPIKAQFSFHKKLKDTVPVALLQIK